MNLLVIGKPGSGKTTWCQQYISQLRSCGLSVGVVLSPETREHGERTGYNVLDVLTGREAPFARRSGDSPSQGEVVGRYTIRRNGIQFARRAIEKAVVNQCDLVVIDEVGPVELSGRGLMPAVKLVLEAEVSVLIIVRDSLKKALLRYFSSYDFEVLADFSQSPPHITPPADWRHREAPFFESLARGDSPPSQDSG